MFFEGKLFESTGLTGQSTLRRVTLATGMVERNFALDATYFGEGLERVDRRLIQLTWMNAIAIVYDLDAFTELARFSYQGEGWGLCFDGTDLVMSNGSDRLVFRDPRTFAVRGEVAVRRGAAPVTRLNELECVGSLVYANVWQTNTIVRIDKATGTVLTDIDASGLLTPAETQAADVLNGIAYDPATRHFYLTGKLWPKLFEVSFDFDPGGISDGGLVDAGRGDVGLDGGGDVTGGSLDAFAQPDGPSDRIDAGTTPTDAGGSKDIEAPSETTVDGEAADASPKDGGAPPIDARANDEATDEGRPATVTSNRGCGCRVDHRVLRGKGEEHLGLLVLFLTLCRSGAYASRRRRPRPDDPRRNLV